VEGGSFSRADIISCLSKESKGSVVSRLDEVTPTGSQRIAMVAFFVAAPLALYAIDAGIDYFYKTKLPSAVASVEKKNASDESPTLEIQGWTVSKIYQTAGGQLFHEFRDGKLRISIQPFIKKKDLIYVPLVFENLSSVPISYTVRIYASGSQDRAPFDE